MLFLTNQIDISAYVFFSTDKVKRQRSVQSLSRSGRLQVSVSSLSGFRELVFVVPDKNRV